jgi:hypothetical protein
MASTRLGITFPLHGFLTHSTSRAGSILYGPGTAWDIAVGLNVVMGAEHRALPAITPVKDRFLVMLERTITVKKLVI